jgi:hypothetical protein
LTATLSTAQKAEALRSVSFKKEYFWLIVIGIVLPLLAMSVELALRICASHSFDPFPSNAHAMMFALIPISNLLILMCVASDFSEHYAFLTLLNGMASGIALTYALMFLPLVPISLMFVFLLGFGLLGLAPFFAFVSTMRAGKIICDLARSHSIHFEPENAKHLGHLLIIASVVAIELPSTLTRVHLDMAAQPGQAQEGIDWLRINGSEEVMLRACYERSGRATDILGSLYEAAHPLDVSKAREIFYTVTGKPFNSVPIPMAARATMQHAGVTVDGKSVEDEFDVDTDIAGENVSGISRGLSMTHSVIAGEPVPRLALAQLTWTFSLDNISKYKREARAKITLPHGGVVTGASLLLNGRWLNASISTRSAARRVYKRSLVKEDHPLLVSTCGPDQILVQSYPVAPNCAVKIELKIVAPFQLRSVQEGAMVLPSLSEQNFGVTGESSFKCTGGQVIENGKIWMCPVTTGFGQYKTERNIAGLSFTATQELTQAPQWTPSKLIVIVDGSASMAPVLPEVMKALSSLPSEMLTKIVFVSDNGNQTVNEFSKPGALSFKSNLEKIESVGCVGGQDDSAQLVEALGQGARAGDTATLWIHGSQPVGTNSNMVAQDWLLSDDSEHPVLYDMQVAPGPVDILNGITFAPGLETVQRFGSVGSDLQNLFSQWAQHSPKVQLLRTCTHSMYNLDPTNTARIDDVGILILAANQRILSESTEATYKMSRELFPLASGLGIVTPISSAIVATRVSTGVYHRHRSGLLSGIRQNLRYIRSAPARMMEPVVSQLNNLSAAGGTAGGSANGVSVPWSLPQSAPVDARYGQSNEVGAIRDKDSEALMQKTANARVEEDEKQELQLSFAKKAPQSSDMDANQLAEEKPVPEPDSIWMILVSLCLLAFVIFQKWQVRVRHSE